MKPIDNNPPLWLLIMSSNVLKVALLVEGGRILDRISISVS